MTLATRERLLVLCFDFGVSFFSSPLPVERFVAPILPVDFELNWNLIHLVLICDFVTWVFSSELIWDFAFSLQQYDYTSSC
ncbi:hypothetical protein L3X38_031854 [Prunus dulcis]|uniref:Uncharacterized protein n=1 Tax=Prunus dulcis TaxID=3755 RepID=A0AAD4VEF6_PRUDU|nr:hypothetical protein L3X38_031854 [Prunus dulcis]